MPDAHSHSTLNDEGLLTRFSEGEERAFRQLFDRYYTPVLFFARHIVEQRPEAEDIVQESFYKLWSRRGEFNSRTECLRR